MDKQVLLSAVGFRAAMVQGVIDFLNPDEVTLIYTHHPRNVGTHQELVDTAAQHERPLHAVQVPDWDMLSWSDAIEALLDRHKDDHVIINVTAGHTLAVAMLAVHAAQRGLPVIVYDWEEEAETGRRPDDWQERIHQHSPGAVLNLRKISRVDRDVLTVLLDGSGTVSELSSKAERPQSSVSTSLARLLEKGFVSRTPRGNATEYWLLPGIQPMLQSALRS